MSNHAWVLLLGLALFSLAIAVDDVWLARVAAVLWVVGIVLWVASWHDPDVRNER